MVVKPITLEGDRVRLEPLAMGHLDALSEFALDEALWRWVPYMVRTRSDLEAYIRSSLEAQQAGTALPFVTIELASGTVAGSTRYMNIDRLNRRTEIGGTIVAPAWQRTFVNTEAKYLMLKHAFEEWDCLRVEFKTDSLNERSRNAILRIGAKEEGTFRNHMIMPGGRVRDSVYYSIIASEWPGVKQRLAAKLHHEPASFTSLASQSSISRN
jgi:RimJ/RimL family protein N-acetyltransferase